jgi:hypothetical protein
MSLALHKMEADLFLAYLRSRHKVFGTYLIEVEILDVEWLSLGRRRLRGICRAFKDRAHVQLAGKWAAQVVLHTLAHEFKHILQAIDSCPLKRNGKARERQACQFADREFFPYAHRRMAEGTAAPQVAGSLETAIMLFDLGIIGKDT